MKRFGREYDGVGESCFRRAVPIAWRVHQGPAPVRVTPIYLAKGTDRTLLRAIDPLN
jgi:hypothetical protein